MLKFDIHTVNIVTHFDFEYHIAYPKMISIMNYGTLFVTTF